MRVQSMRVQRLPLKLLTTTRLLPPSPFSLLRSEHSCALALVALVAGAGGHDCGGGGEGFTYFFSFFRRFRFLLGERLSIGPRFRQLVRRRQTQHQACWAGVRGVARGRVSTQGLAEPASLLRRPRAPVCGAGTLPCHSTAAYINGCASSPEQDTETSGLVSGPRTSGLGCCCAPRVAAGGGGCGGGSRGGRPRLRRVQLDALPRCLGQSLRAQPAPSGRTALPCSCR